MIPWLDRHEPFPPVELALQDPNGLLAAGGDLSTARLLDAYARGIFPWFSDDDPLLWWSPDPRMVLYVASCTSRARCAGSSGRVASASRWMPPSREVMRGCAEPRPAQDGTWITPAMVEAYTRLASLGFAHSVEAWVGDGLVGGLYGVAIGRMFFGESMFTRQTDASKVAFASLVRQLERWGFELIDCQMATSHLASLGAREIPRDEFLAQVARLVRMPGVPSPWTYDGADAA